MHAMTPHIEKIDEEQSFDHKESMPSPIINDDLQHDLNLTRETNPLSNYKKGEETEKKIIKKLPSKTDEEIQKQMQGALDYNSHARKHHESQTHHKSNKGNSMSDEPKTVLNNSTTIK